MELEGYKTLHAQLKALADPKQLKAAERAMVREPMRAVMRRAKQNIAIISPGERDEHRTYKGRLVSAGFASRSIRMAVRSLRGATYAVVGVLAEAYYALQFLELGTVHIQARPWLLPAFASSKDETVKKMGDVMLARLDKISKMRAAEGAST